MVAVQPRRRLDVLGGLDLVTPLHAPALVTGEENRKTTKKRHFSLPTGDYSNPSRRKYTAPTFAEMPVGVSVPIGTVVRSVAGAAAGNAPNEDHQGIVTVVDPHAS
jgi:hypothetical protein